MEGDFTEDIAAVRLCSTEFEEYMIIATTRNRHAGCSALEVRIASADSLRRSVAYKRWTQVHIELLEVNALKYH